MTAIGIRNAELCIHRGAKQELGNQGEKPFTLIATAEVIQRLGAGQRLPT